ncbi:MAG TPA: hypothetical protein VI032_19375 [Burkholderiaceae bacterium]
MTCTTKRLLTSVLLALAGTAAVAEPAQVVWVENESFALYGCGGSDELPGGDDPQNLMQALRERGLADAGKAVRLGGKPESSVTLTPIIASLRCDGGPSSVVFRMSSVDRDGRVSTSHLTSRLTAPAVPVASSR